MSDLIKILDVAEDIAENQEELVKAVNNIRLSAPQVNVTTPPPVVNVSAPAVHVSSPAVNMPAPSVNVSAAAPVAWEFEVTQRDPHGMILKFTATPNPYGR